MLVNVKESQIEQCDMLATMVNCPKEEIVRAAIDIYMKIMIFTPEETRDDILKTLKESKLSDIQY